MMTHGKKNVLGIGVSATDYSFALQEIFECAAENRRLTTTALAVHGVMTGVMDARHRYRLNHLDMVLPDGQPVRWAINLLYGAGLPDKVSGPILTGMVCEQAARQGVPVYFYGSLQTTLDRLTSGLTENYPGLIIAGSSPSRFRKLTSEEHIQAVQAIRASGAKILFVGLGCPRQEVFAYEMGEDLCMPIITVGAAFDYHAGLLKDTPQWAQRLGLQWLHRLIQEPRRLWRRYLVTNLQFIFYFMGQWLGLWRPDLADVTPPGAKVLFG